MIKIYKIIKEIDRSSITYKNYPIIKYIIKNGKNEIKYVSTIKRFVGSMYHGTDSEIHFASLFYRQPIVTVTGIEEIALFNVFYWDYYNIGDMDFIGYIDQDDPTRIDMNEVLKFIVESSKQTSCMLGDISPFILYYPGSYFLVGGTGHWSYAVNTVKLIGAGESPSEGGSKGGNNKYNILLTKKIKNKYYQKSSSTKGTKKRKMTKKHMKSKEYKKVNKKTIKHT